MGLHNLFKNDFHRNINMCNIHITENYLKCNELYIMYTQTFTPYVTIYLVNQMEHYCPWFPPPIKTVVAEVAVKWTDENVIVMVECQEGKKRFLGGIERVYISMKPNSSYFLISMSTLHRYLKSLGLFGLKAQPYILDVHRNSGTNMELWSHKYKIFYSN